MIDLGLTDGSGVAVIRALRQKRPESSSIVVTIFDDNEHLFPALKAGAQGYLMKNQTREQEVLLLISKGLTLPRVATLLESSRNITAGDVKAIYRKLNISPRAEAVIEAGRYGLLG